MAQYYHTTEQSGRIRYMEYDDETLILDIEFVRGGKYRYSNVPYDTYLILINSESLGKSFDQHIKQFPERYPYEKID